MNTELTTKLLTIFDEINKELESVNTNRELRLKHALELKNKHVYSERLIKVLNEVADLINEADKNREYSLKLYYDSYNSLMMECILDILKNNYGYNVRNLIGLGYATISWI